MRKTMTGITNPTEEYFKDGTWGWDGTQWRKVGLLFGYYDRLAGKTVKDNATAGTNIIDSATVPAGELWVVQAIAGINLNTAITKIRLVLTVGSISVGLKDDVPSVANWWVTWTGEVVLKEGDKIQGAFFGCSAGDDLILGWWGYKMRVS